MYTEGRCCLPPPLYCDRRPFALLVFQEPRTGGLEGEGVSVPTVVSDAANFCLLVASVDRDLVSNDVLDYWLPTQASKRWEGDLERDLEEL